MALSRTSAGLGMVRTSTYLWFGYALNDMTVVIDKSVNTTRGRGFTAMGQILLGQFQKKGHI